MKTTKGIRQGKTLLLAVATLLLAGCDFEVVVSKGGTVISDPAGINCRYGSGTCVVKNYEKLGDGNDDVTTRLSAIPDPGYKLAYWKGCDTTSKLSCYKHMAGDIRIDAVFEPIKLAAASGNTASMRFVALGDMGTGELPQYQVSQAIGRVCAAAGGCNFALALGDNLYDTPKPKDAYDPIFLTKFENPYANLNFPFWLTLGNHDNSLVIDGLGSFNMQGDIEVQYSYRTDRASDKWHMPARYYQKDLPEGASTPLASFFSLDSNPFMSTLEINPEYNVTLYGYQQGQWVDNAIRNARGTWKMAFGHHPFLSNGSHGDAGNYDGVPAVDYFSARWSGELYRQWFTSHICGKVDVYFAGHDHDVQMLHSIPECGNTMFVVSGAAAETRELKDTLRNPAIYQKGGQLGFVIAEVVGDKMTLKFYKVNSADGTEQLTFQRTFSRRALN